MTRSNKPVARPTARKTARTAPAKQRAREPERAPRKPARALAPDPVQTSHKAAAPDLASVDELMAHAYAMEVEASERYGEFADAMEAHNNPAVAELFRKLARIEHRHAEQILEEMGWTAPPVPSSGSYRWEGAEGPETGDPGDLHYLMQPYHALSIARHNEERARRFFARLGGHASSATVRRAAAQLEIEEAEHVSLIDAWLARTPKPDADWADDPDPPRISE